MHWDADVEITASAEAFEQLLALYQAGYDPDTPLLRDQAVAQGWYECAHLDRIVACNLGATVVLPDGARLLGIDIMDMIDWTREIPTNVSGVWIKTASDNLRLERARSGRCQ